jgi:hypothetical protein
MRTLDKTVNTLKTLLAFWKTRQVGNTTLMKEGLKNYNRDFALVSHTKGFAKEILETGCSDKGKPFSMDDLQTLIGSKIPVAVDHAVMVGLLEDTLHHIINSVPIDKHNKEIESESRRRVEVVTRKYVSIVDKLTRLAEIYQERSHKVERLFLDLSILHWWEIRERKRIKKEIIDVIIQSNNDELIPELFKGLEDLIQK